MTDGMVGEWRERGENIKLSHSGMEFDIIITTGTHHINRQFSCAPLRPHSIRVSVNQQLKVISKLLSAIHASVSIDTRWRKRRAKKKVKEVTLNKKNEIELEPAKAGKTFNDISCALVFCFHSSIHWHLKQSMNENTVYVQCVRVSNRFLFHITFSLLAFTFPQTHTLNTNR